MQKKIIAINCSPRSGWNTDMLVEEAARGAQKAGNAVHKYNLYKLEKFTGCLSCFGCKMKGHEGECVLNDGLTRVLEDIRDADGLILGTPIYFGNVSALFRALYERLLFQNLTYQKEHRSYTDRRIPVLLIATSNAPSAAYPLIGYKKMLRGYCRTLKMFVGPAKLMTCGETRQVKDYSKYHWTMIDGDKRVRHSKASFPREKEKAFELGEKVFR